MINKTLIKNLLVLVWFATIGIGFSADNSSGLTGNNSEAMSSSSMPDIKKDPDHAWNTESSKVTENIDPPKQPQRRVYMARLASPPKISHMVEYKLVEPMQTHHYEIKIRKYPKLRINICNPPEENRNVECLKYVANWDFPRIQGIESILTEFNFSFNFSCASEVEYLRPKYLPHKMFDLFENGTLRWFKNSTVDDVVLVERNDYCFDRPRGNFSGSDKIIVNVAICQRSKLRSDKFVSGGIKSNKTENDWIQNNQTKSEQPQNNQTNNDQAKSGQTETHQTKFDKSEDYQTMNRQSGNDETNNTQTRSHRLENEQSGIIILSSFSVSPLEIYRAISSFISVPFLITSFFIYAYFPQLRNVHGIVVMSYIASIFATIIIEIVYFFEAGLLQASPDICIIASFSWLYSHLARAFWINVLCFDIWLKFRGFSAVFHSERKARKLLVYFLYGWGCPAIITIISIFSEFYPSISYDFFIVKINLDDCWFENQTAEKVLEIYPITVLNCSNVFLYIMTAWNIHKQGKVIAHHSTGSNSRRHGEKKHWLKLYIKMFVIMGISWALEVTNWWCGYELDIENPHVIVWITELYNASQGLIIFMVFIVNDKVKKLLMKSSNHQTQSFNNLSNHTNISNCSISSSVDFAQRQQEIIN